MRYLPKLCLVVILPAFLLNAGTAANADEITGRIVSVDPQNYQFVLHVNNDEMQTFEMDEDATVYINDIEADLSKLLPDDFVTVIYRQDGDHWYAIEVRCDRREALTAGPES